MYRSDTIRTTLFIGKLYAQLTFCFIFSSSWINSKRAKIVQVLKVYNFAILMHAVWYVVFKMTWLFQVTQNYVVESCQYAKRSAQLIALVYFLGEILAHMTKTYWYRRAVQYAAAVADILWPILQRMHCLVCNISHKLPLTSKLNSGPYNNSI